MTSETLEWQEPTSGRRNHKSHRAIVEATWRLLNDGGYHVLTVEGVAAAAGVGKATIYRWWPSKGSLAVEAITSHLVIGPMINTGDLREDLRAMVQDTINNFSLTVAGVALPALIADLMFERESSEAFRREFLQPRREASAALMRRAIELGNLPADTDIGLLNDLWAGSIFYRILISGEPLKAGLADQYVALILDGEMPRYAKS
jgi:AcrR family transcriptional regulator